MARLQWAPRMGRAWYIKRIGAVIILGHVALLLCEVKFHGRIMFLLKVQIAACVNNESERLDKKRVPLYKINTKKNHFCVHFYYSTTHAH